MASENAVCQDTLAVGKKLVEMCNADQSMAFVQQYYSDDIVSVEVSGMPEVGMPREMKGMEAILAKSKWWYDNNEVHSHSCEGPFPNGNQFIVIFEMDITPTTGPMAGQRGQFKETVLYTVEGGKIVHEQFFYDMGEC